MRKGLLAFVMFAIVPGLAVSQEVKREPKGQGYVFVAPGGTAGCGGATTAMLQFGGGGEGLLYKGLGVGAELGYLTPMRYVAEGIGVLSFNGSYHFLKASASGKVIPFVTGGYSLAFRGGFASAMNLGGGVHYWFGERAGLRIEFRDHFSPQSSSCHFWGARIGLAFR